MRGKPWERSFEARRAPWEEQSSGHPTFSWPYAFPCSFARLSACEVRGSILAVSYGSFDGITPFEVEQVMKGNAKSQIISHAIRPFVHLPTHASQASKCLIPSLTEVVMTANCTLLSQLLESMLYLPPLLKIVRCPCLSHKTTQKPTKSSCQHLWYGKHRAQKVITVHLFYKILREAVLHLYLLLP